jgi:hypothetical protein
MPTNIALVGWSGTCVTVGGLNITVYGESSGLDLRGQPPCR